MSRKNNRNTGTTKVTSAKGGSLRDIERVIAAELAGDGSGIINPTTSTMRRLWLSGTYIGRPARGGSAEYVVNAWLDLAKSVGLECTPLHGPLGVRYLGHTALQSLKDYSLRAPDPENPVNNPGVRRIVARYAEIIDTAFDDQRFNAVAAKSDVKTVTAEPYTRVYQHFEDATQVLILGVGIAESVTRTDGHTEYASPVLARENDYFHQHYDPDTVSRGFRSQNDRAYIPIGGFEGVSGQDSAVQDLLHKCTEFLAGREIKITLGPVCLAQ